ncbi:MAG: tetratricopeptide repeat protein [Cyanobacteria bacterium P01_C01_bin.89]
MLRIRRRLPGEGRGLGVDGGRSLVGADQKVSAIVRGLCEARVMVVLDNLEVVLQPPKGTNPGRALSADWGRLLERLSNGNHRSLVVLTSRELPADLADMRLSGAGPNPGRVRVVPLEGVDEAGAIAILQRLGMTDSVEDLRWIAARVEGHPIALELVAGSFGDRPGYLRKHPQRLAGGLDQLLTEQVGRQSEAAVDLLRRMCVLRVPIDGAGLTFLRLYSEEEGRSEFTPEELEETGQILKGLVRGSLVQRRYDRERCEEEFSLHRVVVEFMERQVGSGERPQLLQRVYRFYRGGKTVTNPKTLDDLQPLLEAQYFAFQLGNYSEAESLICQLEKHLDPWGYWSLKKDLCEQLLPHLNKESQPYLLQRIGFIYQNWGDWNQAENYYQQALKIAKEVEDRKITAGLQGQLGDIERNRGNWDGAEALYRQCLEIEEELGDRKGMASSWEALGYIENVRGNWDGAEALYRQSLELREELGDRQGMASSWGVLGDIERNRGNWDGAEALYRQCLEMCEELGDRKGMATSWGCWEISSAIVGTGMGRRRSIGNP